MTGQVCGCDCAASPLKTSPASITRHPVTSRHTQTTGTATKDALRTWYLGQRNLQRPPILTALKSTAGVSIVSQQGLENKQDGLFHSFTFI